MAQKLRLTTTMMMLVLAYAAVACGGLSPGDYNVYRIAFQEPDRGPGCYPNGQIPVDEQQDSANTFVADTWILYMGADDRVYLDVGDATLQGTESGGDFSFAGEAVDVTVEQDPMGMGGERTLTQQLVIDVQLSLEGKVVEGVLNRTEEFSCAGTACPDPSSCSETINFVGGEVDDVRIEHQV